MGKRQSRLRPEEVEDLVKATHFTLKELNRWYRGFLRDCPNGTLTEQEFCRIYRQFFPFGDPEQLALLVFRGFGVVTGGRGEAGSRGSGVVGFTQFITSLSIATRGTIEERLGLLFRLYDRDGDGCVGREDVEGVMEAMYQMVGPLLAQEKVEERGELEDREGEGEGEELSTAVSARVKEIFSTLAKEGEERLSLDQFIEAVKENPAMSLALKQQQQLLI